MSDNAKKSGCRDAAEKKTIDTRLRRIEGQIRGIQAMVAEDRECIDILRQISSVSGALHGVWLKIVEDHLKGCISEALVRRDGSLVDELVEYLKKVK